MGPPNGVAATGIACRAEQYRAERGDDCQLRTRPRGGAAACTRIRAARTAEADQIGNSAALHRADIELAGNAAALDQHDAARDIKHELEILLDDQHRDPMFLAQACQEFANLLDDRRLNSLRRLIEQEQPRQRYQRTRQCQDLLLAAGKRTASTVQEPGQPRKERQHPLNRPLLGLAGIRRPGQAQIFVRAQARKDAAALRNVCDAEPASLMRRPAGHVHPVDCDLAAARRQQPHNGLHERGLAHAIVADNSDRFAFPELQRDPMQHRQFAIAGLQIGNVEYETIWRDGVIGRGLVHLGLASFANTHARFPR